MTSTIPSRLTVRRVSPRHDIRVRIPGRGLRKSETEYHRWSHKPEITGLARTEGPCAWTPVSATIKRKDYGGTNYATTTITTTTEQNKACSAHVFPTGRLQAELATDMPPLSNLEEARRLNRLRCRFESCRGYRREGYAFPWHAHVPQSGRGTRLRTVIVRVRIPS